MSHSFDYDCDLESKICEMSIYLGNLMLDDEKDEYSGPSTSTQALKASQCSLIPHSTPPLDAYGLNVTTQYPLNSVTSALATRMNPFSSPFRLTGTHPKTRKWNNYKQEENCPDTSDIDINTTMTDLGLTPESLTSNEVYQLFSLFDKLEFFIRAEYIFENIYEQKNLPSTQRVSSQIKHAVWSSSQILRELQHTLKRYTIPVSADVQVQGPLAECKKTLDKLHMSIMQLDAYKYCVLEHRNGKFVSDESRGFLQPLMNALTEVIENVGKSRMYIQVIDWALNKQQEEMKATVAESCASHSKPIQKDDSLNFVIESRPTIARRYIG